MNPVGARLELHDDGKAWDTYSLGRIIKAHLREVTYRRVHVCLDDDVFVCLQVFAKHGNFDEFEARELLKDLIQTVQHRTIRAHSHDFKQLMSEADCLAALATMEKILRRFELSEPADKVQGILREAQELVKLARAAGKEARTVVQKVPSDEAAMLMLYGAMHSFEERLEMEVTTSDAVKDGRRGFRFGLSSHAVCTCML